MKRIKETDPKASRNQSANQSHVDLLADLIAVQCARPFDCLGWHGDIDSPQLRVWYPEARTVTIVPPATNTADTSEADLSLAEQQPGLFTLDTGKLSKQALQTLRQAPLRLRVEYDDVIVERLDPYAAPDWTFTDPKYDAATLYRALGAQLLSYDSPDGLVSGVRFAVYAPHARSVSVIGDWNLWDGRSHPMGASGDGIWRLFIPEICAGAGYKFEIRSAQGDLLPLKSDPLAFKIDQYPSFASRVFDHTAYEWGDEAWQSRPIVDPLSAPINIYEVHLGSWRRDQGRSPTYSELAQTLVDYVVRMGYTHVELLPVSEFPYPASWGYQPVGLYAATSRYGTPDELKYLIDTAHQAGIGVLVDWVPAHFPADEHGLANFDGSSLYEYPDPRKGWHPEWNSLIYDFGREHVCQYLISSAMAWHELFHVDGLRVDAVASMLYLDYSRKHGEWIANEHGGNHNLEAIEFLKRLNTTLYLNFPQTLMIAEESTAFPGVTRPVFEGGLGFGFKWNMGWMNDTLRYMHRDHVYRRYHHDEITFSMTYAWTEHFLLPFSHDEVVHGKGSLLRKMPGDQWKQFANLRALACYQIMHPGKKLNFMGNEFGQVAEWNHDGQLDWACLNDDPSAGSGQQLHRGLQTWHTDLNRLYLSEPALYERDTDPNCFRWLVVDDTLNSVLAFARIAADGSDWLACIINLTPTPRVHYRIGLPEAASIGVVLNSDSEFYGGSNYQLGERLEIDSTPAHGFGQSAILDIPPLCGLILKPLNVEIVQAADD